MAYINIVKIQVEKNLAKKFFRKTVSRKNIFIHQGVYAFKFKTLRDFVSWKPSKNEKELLSDAIGSIQSINPDVATKDRLTLFENAIDNVAKIEKFYAGTDTALKLKTNQNIGDFSITKIRQDYLNEVLGLNLF